jgi:5'-AMP-activated protein kinase catalytic alpha subunit
MIHSKSQKTKKIVPTDDEKLFYTRVKLKEEESNSQIKNKEIKDFFQTSPIKKPDLKKDPSYEYKIGNYLIQQTLGQGTFGKVKLGIYLPTQEKVAIKVLEKERMTDKDDKIRVKREFDMLSKFNHPNVILVTEIFESVDSYYSVMEYCEGGELFNYIVEKKRLSENETSFFYFQIINGLEYIHSLGIVHRDLKPENLLLTKEHLLKIIDFGLSNYFVDGQETLLSTPCGSPCYASPEMVSGKKYNGVKIDIWATGIILFAMLCGYLPFEDKDNEVLFDKILECKIDFPEFLSDESKDLITKILVVDPEERIDINGIKKHSFFFERKKFF